MCVLCGQLLTHVHWADRPSVEYGAGRPMSAGGEGARLRRRERHLRLRLLKIVLGCYGLKVDEWNGTSLLLSDGKGSTALVDDLGQLWPVAEELARRPLDPLDTAFLETISQRICALETTGAGESPHGGAMDGRS